MIKIYCGQMAFRDPLITTNMVLDQHNNIYEKKNINTCSSPTKIAISNNQRILKSECWSYLDHCFILKYSNILFCLSRWWA